MIDPNDTEEIIPTPLTDAIVASDDGGSGFIKNLICHGKCLERKLYHFNKFKKICSKIYIARNITFCDKSMMNCLKEIDKLLRDNNYN